MKETSASGQTVSINGIEIYFETRGDGQPLVLLHGGGGVGANWQLIFPTVPATYQLIVPDLRGHGRSTNPTGAFTFRQSALDVFALLDHLGITQFKAIGLSMGAKTLLHMATQQPGRVEAMVLVSGAPYFPQQAREVMGQFTAASHSEAEWQQMREWHKQGDEQIRWLWSLAEQFKESYTDMNFTPPLLSTIKARTMIVHGDRDGLYPVNLAVEMYEAIPRAYLWIIPNGGHGPIFGEMAERFVETALGFFGGGWEQAA
jgi:pimeloyl-ACP methyl ester carboxylesterase